MAALPSNVDAVEAALMFSTGVHTQVAVLGPSGWGKSHLLAGVCALVPAERGVAAAPVSVLRYLGGPTRSDHHNLVLDDVQEVFSKPRHRQAMSLVLARRVRASRPTLLAFTAAKANRDLRNLLPNYREWKVVAISEPTPEERVLLLNQMGRQHGLVLGSRLVRILARQMHGDGRTYTGALKRLRAVGLNWVDADDTLRAVGLLDACFRDNPDWDLKLRILRLAESLPLPIPSVTSLDLALFVMRQKAELAEGDVARAAGITPAEVYHRANRVRRQAASCEVTADAVRHFVGTVVKSLG